MGLYNTSIQSINDIVGPEIDNMKYSATLHIQRRFWGGSWEYIGSYDTSYQYDGSLNHHCRTSTLLSQPRIAWSRVAQCFAILRGLLPEMWQGYLGACEASLAHDYSYEGLSTSLLLFGDMITISSELSMICSNLTVVCIRNPRCHIKCRDWPH